MHSFEPMAFAPIEELPALSLPQLQDAASFLTRRDRKYIVPADTVASLLDGLEAGTRVLEIDGRRTFRYSTRYFDDRHAAYFRALRKRPDRFKVRTRRYEESGECQLEVKLLDVRGRTVKSRFPHESGEMETLSTLDRAWLRSFEPVRAVASQLEPSVATSYHRSTLVFPDGSGRMTIDQGLTFVGEDGLWQRLESHCVIETKGPGHPLPFDRLLWSAGFRPAPASKFALGVCLTNPDLPHNRWRRLRARLAPALSGPMVASPR